MRSALCALLAVVSLVAAAAARGDGDPASDTLVFQKVFLPYDVRIPRRDTDALSRLTAQAAAKRVPVRVALIARRYDLGAIGVLYLHPTPYARFLSQELTYVYKGRVLVVMPNGYGVARRGKIVPAAQRAVDALPPPGRNAVAIARAAQRAVVAVAGSAGARLSTEAPTRRNSSASTTGRDRVVIAVAALVVCLLIAAFAARRAVRRRL